MKKTLWFALLSLIAVGAVNAATPGSYVGVGIGASKVDTPNQFLFENTQTFAPMKQSKQLGGVGGRVFAGYNFNQYLGIEAGAARYAPSKYKSSAGVNQVTLDYSMNAYDLVGKAYLPLGESGFNVYALGGAAIVNASAKAKATSNGTTMESASKTQNKLRPVYGVGASYDVPNSKVITNLELTRIQGKGDLKTSTSAIPSANMATLSLAYKFD